MFIGIDGTSSSLAGRLSDAAYEEEYRNSFVSELYRATEHGNKRYFQGPDLLDVGRRVTQIASEVESYIIDIVNTTDDRTIVMAGFSRGCAVCIQVAQRMQLNERLNRMTIYSLALFDAVDRTVGVLDYRTIPDNVTFAFHAMRHPLVLSRTSFGNVATEVANLCILESETFRASHAGVGGLPGDALYYDQIEAGLATASLTSDTPIISRDEDIAGSREVISWMWPRIERSFRLNGSLSSVLSTREAIDPLDSSSTPVSEIRLRLYHRLRVVAATLASRAGETTPGRERYTTRATGGGSDSADRDFQRLLASSAVVLRSLTLDEDLMAVLTATEMETMISISENGWIAIIGKAWLNIRGYENISWYNDIRVRSGLTGAVSGVQGQIAEVVMRELAPANRLRNARSRARETGGDALAEQVRYVDRMFTFDPTDHEYPYKELTDGAFIAESERRLYIFGITEVKSGANFSDLIGDRGQLTRDDRRILAGEIVVPTTIGLSHAYDSENISYEIRRTNWYLGGASDETPPDDYFSRELSSYGFSFVENIPLPMSRNGFRSLAAAILSHYPEE